MSGSDQGPSAAILVVAAGSAGVVALAILLYFVLVAGATEKRDKAEARVRNVCTTPVLHGVGGGIARNRVEGI